MMNNMAKNVKVSEKISNFFFFPQHTSTEKEGYIALDPKIIVSTDKGTMLISLKTESIFWVSIHLMYYAVVPCIQI